MKLLILEDYLSSANKDAGISQEKELAMIAECVSFITKMAAHFQIKSHLVGTALTIFHLYQKKFAFTEFDRYMLSSLCVFLAGKIDYLHLKSEDVMRFYYANRKGPKGRVKPFEAIAGELKEDFVDLEFKILITIQFDFEFDSPFRHLEFFKEEYWKHCLSKISVD